MSDRVEAAARVIGCYGPAETVESTDLKYATATLEAADKADAAEGVHRVRVDDTTVERVSRQLFMHDVSNAAGETAPEIADLCDDAARAVLAALEETP